MHEFLFIKDCGVNQKLPFSEIMYVVALNKYIKVVTARKCYLLPITMNSIEKILPHRIFRRIHRSYIVSLYYVNKFDNNMVYVDAEKLPIGKRYKESMLAGIIVLNTDVKSENNLSGNNIDKMLSRLYSL